jgi:hypothetical protein
MKVKELIEMLKGLDQEREILIGHIDAGFNSTYEVVDEINDTELQCYETHYSDVDIYRYGKKLPTETKEVYVIW